MSDQRTFVLIGNFTDNITPALEGINRSLVQVRRTFESFGARRGGTDTLTKSLGKVIGAHINLKREVKELREEMQKSFSTITEYNRLVGRAVRANIRMRQSTSQAFGQQARDIANANTQLRQHGNLSRRFRLTGYRGRGYGDVGGGGGGTVGRPPRAPRPPRTPRPPRINGIGDGGGVGAANGGGGGGGGYTAAPRRNGGGYGGGYSGAVAGNIIGNQLSNTITSAIVRGFSIGTRIMKAPFDYLTNHFKERMEDEISDLKSAGAILSISKRSKNPFLDNMDDAIKYTQKQNLIMTKMGASLPGTTADFTQVGKKISDTIARTVAKDLPGAMKLANEIRKTSEGAKYFGGAPITGTDKKKAVQDTMLTLTGELTKQTTLAGFGGGSRGGTSGAMGAYGLPGLTEQMMQQDTVSMAKMQRYASVFKDPTIQDALARNIDLINKELPQSAGRLAALLKMYGEINLPEMIAKFRRSATGITEELKSLVNDPEMGFFALGRKLKGMGREMNEFGQYVDKTGKATTDVNKMMEANLDLYGLLRDIYANTAQVLTPILYYLPELWDPLKNIGLSLKNAREYTGQFLLSFNEYKEGLKLVAEQLGGAGGGKILETLDIRASLAAINNLFLQLKAISPEQFKSIATELKNPNADMSGMIKSMLETFFNSNVAKTIGEFLGTVIGTVLKQVGDAMKFAGNIVEGAGFGGGFASGFRKAGGFTAINDIFTGLAKLLIEVIRTAFKETPMLVAFIAALSGIPAILGAAVTALVQQGVDSLVGGGRGRRGRGGRGGGGGCA
jgi:methyl-accepting chemotaxis protein